MEIMQVTGSLVCTQRVPGLGHWNLRVLRTPKGKLSVAIDPVGASVGNWVFTASGSAARLPAAIPRCIPISPSAASSISGNRMAEIPPCRSELF